MSLNLAWVADWFAFLFKVEMLYGMIVVPQENNNQIN